MEKAWILPDAFPVDDSLVESIRLVEMVLHAKLMGQ